MYKGSFFIINFSHVIFKMYVYTTYLFWVYVDLYLAINIKKIMKIIIKKKNI